MLHTHWLGYCHSVYMRLLYFLGAQMSTSRTIVDDLHISYKKAGKLSLRYMFNLVQVR